MNFGRVSPESFRRSLRFHRLRVDDLGIDRRDFDWSGIQRRGRWKHDECGVRGVDTSCSVKCIRGSCEGYRVRTEILERVVLEHIADKVFTFERCKSLVGDLVEQTGVLNQRTA
jgi:hypothetical protein